MRYRKNEDEILSRFNKINDYVTEITARRFYEINS